MRKIQYAIFSVAMMVLLLVTMPGVSVAQVQRYTAVGAGQTIDISVHSDCKRVYYDGWGGNSAVAAPWDTPAEWQNFYNNPPPGVSISACPPSCGGYSYGGYCYRAGGDGASCDTACASFGGCNLAGGAFVGSDDPSGGRCSAVVTALYGTATVYPYGGVQAPYDVMGCFLTTSKGGSSTSLYYVYYTDCSTGASGFTRICACNG